MDLDCEECHSDVASFGSDTDLDQKVYRMDLDCEDCHWDVASFGSDTD